MRETEIRDRLREAIGEARYPSALKGKVVERLGQPASRTNPAALGLVAALLAVLIVVSLVYIRVQTAQPGRPAAGPSPRPTASPFSPVPAADIPTTDLAAADLTPAAVLVSQVDLVATSGGRTVRLVGAYADPARTVFIFRTLPAAGSPTFQVSDSTGPLNVGSGGAAGAVGDQIVYLFQGPSAGSDGMAHLNVAITGFDPIVPAEGRPIYGSWNFAFDLRVQPATSLPLPGLISTGSDRVNVETFELTPSVIHFKGVVHGASPSGVLDAGVSVVDGGGNPIHPAGSAVPVGGSPGATRIDLTWPRPASAATYDLHIVETGREYRTSIGIPAPPAIDNGKPGKGHPLGPADFPVAQQSLNLQGAITDHISSGNPQSCGAGSGPDGLSLFAFATYFQSRAAWYYVSFYTDKAVQAYHGPGTYKARATLSPVSSIGPTNPMFTGTPQLTVSKDNGLHQGSVSGTLAWTDDPSQTLTITGTWTCMPGQELGPA